MIIYKIVFRIYDDYLNDVTGDDARIEIGYFINEEDANKAKNELQEWFDKNHYEERDGRILRDIDEMFIESEKLITTFDDRTETQLKEMFVTSMHNEGL